MLRAFHLFSALSRFQTAFVRQKTPHPKELKAKAHKLFGSRDRSNASASAAAADDDGGTTGGETNGANGIDPAAASATNGIGNGSANHVGGEEDNNEESEEVSAINDHACTG